MEESAALVASDLRQYSFRPVAVGAHEMGHNGHVSALLLLLLLPMPMLLLLRRRDGGGRPLAKGDGGGAQSSWTHLLVPTHEHGEIMPSRSSESSRQIQQRAPSSTMFGGEKTSSKG